jgi:Ca-activated chloride channel homolog
MIPNPLSDLARRAARSSLTILVALLTSVPALHAQQAASTTTTAAPAREVGLTLTVTNDRGKYIRGLGREHVEVFEGKVARAITSFGPADEYASIGVLFDISASMRSGRGGKLEAARHAFARFVRQASPANEYFLSAFKKDGIELTDWTRDATAIRAGLDKIAPAVVPKDGDGGTYLYDALGSALAKLARGSHPRRVLLIFTDGGRDNYSRRFQLKDVKRLLRASDVLVYTVVLYERDYESLADPEGQVTLDELASLAGGKAFYTQVGREVDEAVDSLVAELSRQYVIGFAPTDGAKRGELNKVRVKISAPPEIKGEIRVRAREGYLTP